MGLPALRSEPLQTAPASIGLDRHRGPVAGVVRPTPQCDLVTIVESVFDPSDDLVIYESPAAAAASRDHGPRLLLPPGTGLSAAAACIDAQARLGRSERLVVVIDPSTCEKAWEAGALVPARLHQRIVVVAPAPAGRNALACALEAADWHVADLRGGSTARGIAKALIAARYDERATVVLIDETLLPRQIIPRSWDGPASKVRAAGGETRTSEAIAGELRLLAAPEPRAVRVEEIPGTASGMPIPSASGHVPSQRMRRGDGLELLSSASARKPAALWADELQEIAAADPQVIPIVLLHEAQWAALARPDSISLRLSPVQGVERALAVGAALSRIGCHSVLVIGSAATEALAGWASEALRRDLIRTTILVWESAEGAPQTRADDALSGLPVTVVPQSLSREGIRKLLRDCAATRQTHVLRLQALEDEGVSRVAPLRSVAAPSGPDVQDGPHTTDLSPTGIPYAVSAESAQLDQQEIEHKQLRLDVLRWVQEYDRIGGRNLYLWRWCLHGIELTTFPDVDEGERSHLHDTKLLSVILCVLFDDIADRHGPTELLESMIQSASGRSAAAAAGPEWDAYLESTLRLWHEYEGRVRQYPHYCVFERLWRFDLLQFLNTMRYSHLVNSLPGLLNVTEHDVYTPHNMLMVSFATLDLMCIDHFAANELGHLREAMWHAQSMGRIGNVLSTWRRELAEADHSSGVFAGDVSLSPSSNERLLLEKWRWHRTRCHAAAEHVRSLNLKPVLAGHDRFLDMHLASAGRI